ncbi:MAG: restriction endonuclease [Opitutaceae bacterium]|nr:restriction endonuclease [Opitutaceae bacterium]
MPIPDYETIKLPALGLLADGVARPIRVLCDELAKTFHITPEERAELLPSGTQQRWNNRVNWACYDLYKANILQRPKKGVYQITDSGRKILGENPASLNRVYLRKFPHFLEWDKGSSKPAADKKAASELRDISSQTANERLDAAFEEMHAALKEDLLEQIRKIDPYEFEQLVVDVLVAMGYGGSRTEAAKVTQRSGDEGIDGIINEDRLGLDVVYIQAKRWQTTVGRKELQAFVGALSGQKATKGVFITSGEFAHTAQEFVGNVQQKVVLIDGAKLAELMIEHGVGVSEIKTYVLKRIDSDYFGAE